MCHTDAKALAFGALQELAVSESSRIFTLCFAFFDWDLRISRTQADIIVQIICMSIA
jgi:hypothetical protein